MSNKIKDGGPALPGLTGEHPGTTWPGMSMRAYYAAHSPVGFDQAAATIGRWPDLRDDAERASFFTVWAKLRLAYADAMIQEMQ